MTSPARPPRRAVRFALALAAASSALAAATSLGAGRGVAQGEPAQTPANALALTAQSAWVSSSTDGVFHMGLSIRAADPAGTRLAVTVYERLTNRSDFNESIAGRIRSSARHFFKAAPLPSLQADATGAYSVDLPVNPSPVRPGQDILSVQTPGVYPVGVTLIDPSGQTLAGLVTHLLYTGDATSSQTPLHVAWVFPLRAATVITPAGHTGRLTSQSSQPLSVLARALGELPEVPVTLTPTAETLDALAIGSASDRAILTTFAGVVARAGTQVVNRPYVALSLPSVIASGLDGELTAQLRRASETVSATLGVLPETHTWIGEGPLDRVSLDDLIDRGVRHVVIDPALLSRLPSDLGTTTFAQPFTLRGDGGRRAVAVVSDDGLASHFAGGGDRVLAAHQLLADMAIIESEEPAITRGVVLLTPSTWHADPVFLREVLGGLAASPWLKPVTVEQLFAGVPEARERQSALERTVASRASSPLVPTLGAIRSARHRLDSLSTMLPADSEVYGGFERLLLSSESSDLSARSAGADIELLSRILDQETHSVRLSPNTSITLTARQGRFPVTIISTASYAARVRITLTSSEKLVFQTIAEPGASCQSSGTSEICTLELRTPNTTLKVPVLARTAGVFTLAINLTTPDGGLTLATAQDTVRSTAASGVGIFLSIGAFALLAMWWARDLHHGRRARGLVPATPGGIPPGDLDQSPGNIEDPAGAGAGGPGRIGPARGN